MEIMCITEKTKTIHVPKNRFELLSDSEEESDDGDEDDDEDDEEEEETVIQHTKIKTKVKVNGYDDARKYVVCIFFCIFFLCVKCP